MALVLFDIDNTLLDTRTYQTRAYEIMFPEVFGVHGSLDQLPFGGAGGMTYENITKIALANGVSVGEIKNKMSKAQKVLSKSISVLLPGNPTSCLLPGVPSVLRKLYSKFALGVLSGNPVSIAGLLLEWADIRSYFIIEAFGKEGLNRSDLIKLCIRQYNSIRNVSDQHLNIVMVGDSSSDILSAKENGIQAVGVTTGVHTSVQLRESGADYTIRTLNDLIGVLGNGPVSRFSE